MPELTVNDVEQFTNGRLAKDNPETARQLAAAYDAVRRYCGWHVSPVIDDDVTLDGPASRLLVLPTLALVTLTTVTEDGVELDVAELVWSTRGLIRKRLSADCWARPHGFWWSGEYGAIKVAMSHGFDSAPSFDSAVLSYVDRTSQSIGAGQREVIGPFQFGATPAASGAAFSGEEQAVLDKFKLEWVP